MKGLELQPGDRPQTVKAWLEMLKPPQPKPPVQYQYTDPATVPVSLKPDLLPPLLKEDGGIKSDRNSQTVTRRNWLKYSGLAVASMVVALVSKEIIDNFSQTSDNDIELTEYEFDVITVNDRGAEINREKGSAKYFTEYLGNGTISLDMVEIPADTFMMGSPEHELYRKKDERQHEVTVPSFFMSKYPITQSQWRKVVELPRRNAELDLNPSKFKGNDLPVENISWYDAVEFCRRLSKATSKGYRLPSEAEWEYACRARTTTPFHFGETITSELVNYDGSYTYANEPKGEDRKKTTSVGSFSPNTFGLYDMHGNIWEWCADTYDENYQDAPNDGSAFVRKIAFLEDTKVLRGGYWDDRPKNCRSPIRNRDAPLNIGYSHGFRCVVARTL